MSDLLQIIPSVLGGGFIGSAATHYLTTGQARREARSAVLNRLTEVESSRWASEASRAEWSTAMRDFETAALITRLPHNAVATYMMFVHTSRNANEQDADDNPIGDVPGVSEGEFADIVRRAADEISKASWRPTISRIRRRHRLKQLETDARAIKSIYLQITLTYAAEWRNYRWLHKQLSTFDANVKRAQTPHLPPNA